MHAKVRGTDPESDLAVLKADGKELPAITFGKLDSVQVGDTVLAIGNPFGFGNTVTHGHHQRARTKPDNTRDRESVAVMKREPDSGKF